MMSMEKKTRPPLRVVIPDEELPGLPVDPSPGRNLPASESAKGIHTLKYKEREAPANLPVRHIDRKEAAKLAADPPEATWKRKQLKVTHPEKHRMTRAMAAHLMGKYDNDLANTSSSEMEDARKQSNWLRNTGIAIFIIVIALIVLRVVLQDSRMPEAKPATQQGVNK